MEDMFICVLDFEATCWDGTEEHEIIEFPSVLLKWGPDKGIEIIDTIQIFVKPAHNPTVSEFCYNLTGITQDQVNAGVSLQEALKQHHAWLSSHSPVTKDIVIVTCGDWDLKTMLPEDLRRTKLPYPGAVYKSWVNIKQIFQTVVKCKRCKTMVWMLKTLDLELEGRHHSGIDDCGNIAKIFMKLVSLGLEKSDVELKRQTI